MLHLGPVEVILGGFIFILLFERVLLGNVGLFAKVIALVGWSECRSGVVLGLGTIVMLGCMWCLTVDHENRVGLVVGDELSF